MMIRFQTLLSNSTCAATAWARRGEEREHTADRGDDVEYAAAHSPPRRGGGHTARARHRRRRQGLTLVHYSAQRKHILLDALGA